MGIGVVGGAKRLARTANHSAGAGTDRCAGYDPAAMPTVDVVIPAFNEERALPGVLAEIPSPPVRRIVVGDNNSRDRTAQVATDGGAVVVAARRQGYGSACLAALAWLRANQPPEIVVFLDADHSDHPAELPALIAPILAGATDLVIGSRVLGAHERGALLPQARFGNWLATRLIALLYGVRFTDLGPFRAIRWSSLEGLKMRDPDFGWTAEMQVKAARRGLRCAEVPVSYRRRAGVSKITGTVRGTLLAGWKILGWTLGAWR
jgi:glycosyltransferase involved in cell wall biosynthesis